ncbi:MAG: hypothetical protein HPAVJP_0390 [Candidatus Hepatoplasma vulgare]|nr:MAG: hypothetical protein HPAVJP_0390 [Candidatus Hepatoplasma sp.]
MKREKLIHSFKELKNEINIDDFELLRDKFTKICQVIPNREKESLKIDYKDLDKKTIKRIKRKQKVVYIMVIEGKIFYVGCTNKSLRKRLAHYNDGRERYRKEGEIHYETTYFILQSLLNINKPVDIYVHYYRHVENETFMDIFGEEVDILNRSPSKTIKKWLLDKIESEFNKKPIGNRN